MMTYNHWNQIAAINLCKDAAHLNSIDIGQHITAPEFIQSSLTNIEQHTDLLLGHVHNLIQIILHLVHQLQASQIKHSDKSNEINQDALTEEVKDDDVKYEDNDDIFAQLNDFILQYNQHRNTTHQINGDAVTRCFIDNIMDYTDFGDLNSNLKRYGVRAGAVRKLWRFLNPVKKDEIEQDDENVVVIPIGSYIYIPFKYNNDELINFEIGENLSVPSDWSDDE